MNDDNWKVLKTLKQGEIFMYRDVIRKALKNSKFEYRYDKDFISSLKPNKDYSDPYIYSYDISDTLLDRGQFVKELEDLLKVANYEMSQSKKFYNKYKFDILGSWTTGQIIVMSRYELTEKEQQELDKRKKKEVKKFYKQTGKEVKKTVKDLKYYPY